MGPGAREAVSAEQLTIRTDCLVFTSKPRRLRGVGCLPLVVPYYRTDKYFTRRARPSLALTVTCLRLAHSLAQLRAKLVEAVPHLKDIDQVPKNAWTPVEGANGGTGDFAGVIVDHYLTNPILRAAPLMGELQAGARERKAGKLAAE